MINQQKNFIFVVLAVLSVSACANIYHKTDTKVLAPRVALPEQAVELAKANTEIGDGVKFYDVPVKLSKLPDKPKLILDFIVADKGHCLVTYVPTEVLVNSKKIASIDFRDFDFEARRVIEIPVSKENLKIGTNIFSIHTGECDFDIDVMQFNSFKLLQR